MNERTRKIQEAEEAYRLAERELQRAAINGEDTSGHALALRDAVQARHLAQSLPDDRECAFCGKVFDFNSGVIMVFTIGSSAYVQWFDFLDSERGLERRSRVDSREYHPSERVSFNACQNCVKLKI